MSQFNLYLERVQERIQEGKYYQYNESKFKSKHWKTKLINLTSDAVMMLNNQWHVTVDKNNIYSLYSYNDKKIIEDNLSLEQALNLIEQIVVNNITELKNLMKPPTPKQIEKKAQEIIQMSDFVLKEATIPDLLNLIDPNFNSEIRKYYPGYSSDDFKELLIKIVEKKPTIKDLIIDRAKELNIPLQFLIN